MKKILVGLFILFSQIFCFANENICPPLFSLSPPEQFDTDIEPSSAVNIDGTSGFINAFAAQIKNKRMGIRELEALIKDAQKNKLENPIPITKKDKSSWALLAYETFQEYLDHSQLNHEKIFLQPNNPVETISWYSALVFANRYSIKHGLRSVYDLSRLSDLEGRAEDGTLFGSGEVRVRVLGGNIYEAEGYRLPTSAEWELIARKLGNHKQEYLSADVSSAWLARNSGGKTHPVGELAPIMINNQPISDWFGNIGEFVYDTWGPQHGGGIDPFVRQGRLDVLVRGGSWTDDGGEHFYKHMGTSFMANGDVGFRLVRTIQDSDKK